MIRGSFFGGVGGGGLDPRGSNCIQFVSVHFFFEYTGVSGCFLFLFRSCIALLGP